ncbi:adenosylcobinamide kinase/adenosylcobinamide-phosphate guanylyltransferase [Bacilli bacterium PM5-3]|nr:adenosylcobinamide kinase/adenosylcobinamide-phosphate guanylyltransferase [Bacilli bacterium PM5-3]MDH6604174.1 adenosylcobinamide kinase/adenosylcobinamide-phosphate guanylyltransferase [Bacilli bacterium PM5-9]
MYKLITGGARSGKSLYAESLLNEKDDVTYIASYIYDKNDNEMVERIRKHQEQRNSNWKTIEVDYCLDVSADSILFDCLSVFSSNVLYKYSKDIEYVDKDLNEKIYQRIILEIDKLFINCKDIIIVTNEVGYGLVPSNHIERIYRDLLGRVNRYVANKCDEVYLVVCGQNIKIKGDM